MSTTPLSFTGTLRTKRECPCDTCPLFDQCAANGTECSAFRNWGTNGDFKDEDVQRLLRVGWFNEVHTIWSIYLYDVNDIEPKCAGL